MKTKVFALSERLTNLIKDEFFGFPKIMDDVVEGHSHIIGYKLKDAAYMKITPASLVHAIDNGYLDQMVAEARRATIRWNIYLQYQAELKAYLEP